jgi:hypothetical protein
VVAAVELDDEPLVAPDDVSFGAVEPDVDFGLGEAGLLEQLQGSSFEL